VSITETVTALATIEAFTPIQLFEPGAAERILDAIKAEVRALAADSDISTPDGRKAISALAYKVSRTKTFIESQRVVLVAEEKQRLAKVDAEGRRMRDELDALRDEVRKPLTDWEKAESDRIAEHEMCIRVMGNIADTTFTRQDKIDQCQESLDKLWQRDYQEFAKRAQQAHHRATQNLKAERARLAAEAAERIEKERLRAEAAEKARIQRDAEIAEQTRLKVEAEAKEREEKAAAEAAEKLRAAETKAEHADFLAKSLEEKAQKIKADLAAARQKAETDRLAAEDESRKWRQQVDEAERRVREIAAGQIHAETIAEEPDLARRKTVHHVIIRALMAEGGLAQNKAVTLVRAIAEGKIAHVSISYAEVTHADNK
jgi:colicin import membrane protein